MAKASPRTPSPRNSASTAEAPVSASKLAAKPDLKALFWAFSTIGISGFGGVLPFARRMLVEERRWMSAEEFNTQLGLCQFLPGPNVINLAVVVGKRHHGVAGAVISPLGMLAGPLLVVLLLALLYDAYGQLPWAQGMLRGIAAAGCGLLFAMAFRMAGAIREKRLFLPFSALAVAAIAGWRLPLHWVMLVGLTLSAALAYWHLGRR